MEDGRWQSEGDMMVVVEVAEVRTMVNLFLGSEQNVALIP